MAAIGPLIEGSRWRLGGIPDVIWLEPYMVGFVGMLITLVAKRNAPLIGDAALGLVQGEAWASITGLGSDLIGEEMLHLSMRDDMSFREGCRNAREVFDALFEQDFAGASAEEGEGAIWADPRSNVEAHPDLALTAERAADVAVDLWQRHFEAHLH